MQRSGVRLASGQQGCNANVLLWDTGQGQPVFKFEEHDHMVVHLQFSPDDRLLASVGNARDGAMVFWDVATGKVVARAAQARLYLCPAQVMLDVQ